MRRPPSEGSRSAKPHVITDSLPRFREVRPAGASNPSAAPGYLPHPPHVWLSVRLSATPPSTHFIIITLHGFNLLAPPSLRFSLKLECEKLAQEKTEIQRQYIMVSKLVSAEQFTRLLTELTFQNCSNMLFYALFSTTRCPTGSTWRCTNR